MSGSNNKQQKVVLITGGSRGIGEALVNYFKLHDKWTVATCATSKKGLSQSEADIKFVCDVTNVDQVKAGISQIIKRYSQIDVLINNAGIAGSNPLTPDSSDRLWHKILDTNLNGTYYMCKYALPYIKPHQGRIINIASTLGIRGVADQSAYCAAKHGVIGLTKSLALYAAPKKITVNAICPGWVDTEMAEGRFVDLDITRNDAQKDIPLGKILNPKEIASLAYYLASSESACNVTGQSFVIDGGITL